MSGRRFVLLDRDGTLIVERNYLASPEQVELLPGAVEGLCQLAGMGLGLIVVTNQSGIGRGYFDHATLDLVHSRLREHLAGAGISLDGIYVCPHTPEADCACRKPRLGLVQAAAHELDFDPAASFVIGDKPCDVELGECAGATTFLVRTGYGVKVEADGTATPDFIVDDLAGAARVIQGLL
jgi:D-glycero-D-manno-heptose 1,7-bisphosphate phosphatase